MAWDKRIVSMAEHLVHILGGTYATQGGVHSTSAGLSVKTKADITTATCQKYERHFANTSRRAIRDILLDTPEGDRSLVIQRVKQLQTQKSQLPSDTQEFLRSLPPLVALES